MMLDYEAKKARLSEQMKNSNGVRLDKPNSNLFREREKNQNTLSVRDFNHVIVIHNDGSGESWAEVEGMTTYEDFVKETLKCGLMPTVVPQLKTITVGGAVAGVGIEATSFRYGLVHETIISMEVLLATGEIVACSKNEHADLFYSFPNSYGTLGYVLKLKVKLIPVKPFVKLEHTRYDNTEQYFQALNAACALPSDIDFVDGAMFNPAELYITTGIFVDNAPFVSDYTYKNIYYHSIKEKSEDYLSVEDFIWRWDTDWFWCSANFGAQNPILRRLYGKQRLNSRTYWKIIKFAKAHPFIIKFNNRFSPREEIIQDIETPIENAPAFAKFFFEKINIKPIWICPVRTYDKTTIFKLYHFENPEKLYVNFGFWDSIATNKAPGYYNRLIEATVTELHGNKSLYSDSFYTPEEFWKIYDKPLYDALKEKYDPQHKLKGLYEKCVERQ
jgi:FAD/FMN-containing dehydrogenase